MGSLCLPISFMAGIYNDLYFVLHAFFFSFLMIPLGTLYLILLFLLILKTTCPRCSSRHIVSTCMTIFQYLLFFCVYNVSYTYHLYFSIIFLPVNFNVVFNGVYKSYCMQLSITLIYRLCSVFSINHLYWSTLLYVVLWYGFSTILPVVFNGSFLFFFPLNLLSSLQLQTYYQLFTHPRKLLTLFCQTSLLFSHIFISQTLNYLAFNLTYT